MFKKKFGLVSDPFTMGPNLSFLYQSKAFDETMAHLLYGLEQNEDLILITGSIGTGKTLSLHNLVTHVAPQYDTVMINVTQMDFPELLKFILLELGVDLSGPIDVAELAAAFKKMIMDARTGGRKILLVIDEAQLLAVDALEGVRLLMNIGQPGSQVLQIILAGQPGLEEKIKRDDLVQLRQRIRVHYRVQSLDRRELEEYIDHRVKIAGCDRSLFQNSALDLIFERSRGVPRVVNILCSQALLAAYVDDKDQVLGRHVPVDDLPPVPDEYGNVASLPASDVPAPLIDSKDMRHAGDEIAAPAPPIPVPPVKKALRPRPSESGRTTYARRRSRGVMPLYVGLGLALIAVVVVLGLKWNAWFPVLAPADEAIVEVIQAPVAVVDEPVVQENEVAPVDSVPVAVEPKGFAVHLASFLDSHRADNQIEILRRMGFDAFKQLHASRGQQWERVYAGPYPDRATVRAASRELRLNGFTTYARIVDLGS